jgi:hypothetical protein
LSRKSEHDCHELRKDRVASNGCRQQVWGSAAHGRRG